MIIERIIQHKCENHRKCFGISSMASISHIQQICLMTILPATELFRLELKLKVEHIPMSVKRVVIKLGEHFS